MNKIKINTQLVLNSQQSKAKDLIIQWFKNETKNKQTFVLSGYAGTGKTTLINFIIQELNLQNSVAFATPTGKAASVLIQKGSEASTIHHLIYTPVEKDVKTDNNGKTIKSKKIEFVKKKSIGNFKLIIIDEISMVNNKILNDLLSYKIPLLVSGDPGQLPPIESDTNTLLQNPDIILTEIVRQEENNAILKIANDARNNIPINYGNYNDQVIVLNKKNLSQTDISKLMLSVDQVLCGRNSTRNKLNTVYRNALGKTSWIPEDGEKIICNLNNYEISFDDKYSLANGIQGYISNFKVLDNSKKLASISFKPEFSEETINDLLIDSNAFENNTFLYQKHQKVYLLSDGSYKIKLLNDYETRSKSNYKQLLIEDKKNKLNSLSEFMINQFEYGYVISVHKSQGSEWNTILIFDESYCFGENKNKWLYTAITRGKEKVIIIK